MNIQLMTDGGADIPNWLKESLHIKIVPLYLHFSDEQYNSDQVESQKLFKKIKDLKELPRSSTPSPNDFYQYYKEMDPNKPILMLSISGGLSSSYENAVAGKNMILEKEPNRQIEVINTKTASCGIALLLHESGRKIGEGLTFDELVEHIHGRVQQTATLFVLKTLENLVIGGRLDKVKGTIAKTLNIRLLMRGSEEGTIEVSEKVRGDKKSIRRLIEQIGEQAKNMEDKIISMSHGDDEERAKTILSQIQENFKFKDALLMETGPLISTYGGEGAIVISFFKD